MAATVTAGFTPRPRPRAGGANRPPLRLVPPPARRTIRPGRLVALLVGAAAFVVLAALVLGLGSGPLTGPAPSTPSRAATVHVVQPGDTLWSIASELHPDADVRAIVDELVEARGGRPLQPGERIVVGG